MKKIIDSITRLMLISLNLFDANTNVTTDSGMSPEMKTYWNTLLIMLVEPNLVHDIAAQKTTIPPNNGKVAEFRKWNSLPKALTPLTEGVTPDGEKLAVTSITSEVHQYGSFVGLSDVLIMTTVDPALVQATKAIASQASRTLDTVTREVLNGGTSVQFGEGTKLSRHALVGGDATAANNDYMSVLALRKAVRALKVQNAAPVEGNKFFAIIHPDCEFDIMSDPDWKAPHTYKDTTNVYDNEIGELYGVRFLESTEAKVFHADDLTDTARTLKVASYSSKVITLATDTANQLTAAQAAALAGRMIIVGTGYYTVVSATAYVPGIGEGAATAATITIKETPTSSPSANDIVYPGEAGAAGRDVYSTLIFGANAYGTTELANGGLRHIVKQLGSGGTSDPLDQRATVGWKAAKAAVRLVETYMIRIETTSTFEVGAN